MEAEILTEDNYFELEELGIEPLNEVGGVTSWLRRMITGRDKQLNNAIIAELTKVKTVREKENLLNELDKFIEEAEGAREDGTFGTILHALGFATAGGVIGAIGGAGYGGYVASKLIPPTMPAVGKIASMIPGVSGIINTKFAAKMAAFKGAQLGHVIRGTVTGLSIGALLALLIVVTFRTVNILDGSMDDYISALKATRILVQQHKVV